MTVYLFRRWTAVLLLVALLPAAAGQAHAARTSAGATSTVAGTTPHAAMASAPRAAASARTSATTITTARAGATVTPRAAMTVTPGAAMTATVAPTTTGTLTTTGLLTGTATPRPAALPSATPRATSNPHPGFGAVPWAPGEFYQWAVAGPGVTGTAWQLLTRQGHQWIDQSALLLQTNGITSTFTSRLAFDANTYALRRYDGAQDTPASVLHATLFGTRLDYTSYQSWAPAGCVVYHGSAPAATAAYGMMSDLARATPLRVGQRSAYALFDPYGAHVTATASYSVTATASYSVTAQETLSTVLGRLATVHARFAEGAQPPLDVWYGASAAHIVARWSMAGSFTATLAHYEPASTRTALPLPPVTLRLSGRDAACM